MIAYTISIQFLTHLKETKHPLVLNVNGKAELVVQDSESYQKLIEEHKDENPE